MRFFILCRKDKYLNILGKKSTKRKGSTANCENNTSTVISIESSGDESESDEEPFVMNNNFKDDNEPLIKKRNIDINDSLNQVYQNNFSQECI